MEGGGEFRLAYSPVIKKIITGRVARRAEVNVLH